MTAAAFIHTAAGLDGSPCGALETLGAASALERLAGTLQRCGVRSVFLLTPPSAREALEKHMSHWETCCLEIPEGAAPLAAFRCGLAAAGQSFDRTLLLAADVPFLAPATVRALLSCPAPLCRAVTKEGPGAALCAGAEALAALAGLPGDLPLSAPEEIGGIPVTPVPVSDRGVLPDARARGYYPELLRRSKSEGIRVSVKVRLCGERPFFGPAPARLLRMIARTGSVRDACLQMGLSYSKGRKIIAVMEEELGISIVLRQQGGKNGGSATLTPQGEALIERFDRLEERCRTLAEEAYREIFLPPPGSGI